MFFFLKVVLSAARIVLRKKISKFSLRIFENFEKSWQIFFLKILSLYENLGAARSKKNILFEMLGDFGLL